MFLDQGWRLGSSPIARFCQPHPLATNGPTCSSPSPTSFCFPLFFSSPFAILAALALPLGLRTQELVHRGQHTPVRWPFLPYVCANMPYSTFPCQLSQWLSAGPSKSLDCALNGPDRSPLLQQWPSSDIPAHMPALQLLGDFKCQPNECSADTSLG